MYLKKLIISFLALLGSFSLTDIAYSATPKHFRKIMIVMFENMSYNEIQNEPTFKRLVEYTGSTLDKYGKLHALDGTKRTQDNNGFGYAFFSSYYNNHSGGDVPTRSSQPNYIALTSGSIQGIIDNNPYDLDVDNLAIELKDAKVSWKVYAENLPSSCFTGEYAPNKDGYARKHEPLISYDNIRNNMENCKNIVNARVLTKDIKFPSNLPNVSLYIPNQIHDGHNGILTTRTKNANEFLSAMMGTDPNTGDYLSPTPNSALFKKFLANDGLLFITFDEPSVDKPILNDADKTIYTLMIGKMIKSGAYPNTKNENVPICFPEEQDQAMKDINGPYNPQHCNHYNLLKMIEKNWSLRGLEAKNTSNGYQYAYSLDDKINLWKK